MKLLGAIVLLTLGLNVNAQTPPQTEAEPVSGSAKKESQRRYYSNESADNRQDKTWEISAILLGVGPSISSTSGLIGAYHLSPDEEILVEITGGKLTSDTGDFDDKLGSSYDIKTSSIGIHYKRFAGNSFYFRTGLDARFVKYDYQYRSIAFPANNSDIEFSGRSLALNFQIGNQWQWENFTMGCDWIGVSVPITSSIKEEKFESSGTFASLDRKQYDDDSRTLVKAVHANFLRFYLGASF